MKHTLHRGWLYLFSNVNICGPVISVLRKYYQFGNLTLSFALFWSLKKNFNYQIFCNITYVTGCYSLTLPLSEGLYVAKSLQDIRLQEKYGLQNSPWGEGKPYPASGLFGAGEERLGPSVAWAAVRSRAMVLLLLAFWLLQFPLWESVIALCFVVRYFMSILVLQSSWWERESWLLCLVCLPGVAWWLSGSSSRCHGPIGVVCGVWLWYFLIILTYYFWWRVLRVWSWFLTV